MFSVTVRDRMMVAHSLRGEFFGPAQRLHGATYVVDVTFSVGGARSHGVVADIGAISRELRAVLADLEYRNLDEHPAFAGVNTTTEVPRPGDRRPACRKGRGRCCRRGGHPPA